MITRIVSDSSCDLTHLDNADFVSVPLTISAGENEWTDNADLNVNDMLDTLAAFKGPSHTACPGTGLWLNAFEGADEIYVPVLTGTISGTYNAAMNAREIYLESHPNCRIHVFDSLTTGPALRLIVEKINELKQKRLPFEHICAEVEAYMKKTRIFFIFRSLHNFAQNGRVSKAVAAAVGVLGIRIMGMASAEGTLQPLSKCRNDKGAIAEILRQLEKQALTPKKLLVTHTCNEDLARTVLDALRSRFPAAEGRIAEARGLTSYYGERNAVFIGMET